MNTSLHLEARKNKAFKRWTKRMEEGRLRGDLPSAAKDAYLLGLREGYKDGMVDGVGLGLDVKQESESSYDSPEVGEA